jgi:chemotaxis response regulator CheB
MNTNIIQRVVVLGREGAARDQLLNALSELGVSPERVGRPSEMSPEQLIALNPNRVIVSLEPSIASELAAYDEFLSQPTLTVLYDDAETTATLSGWDLNRWARHMAVKLLNTDVLPRTHDDIDLGNDVSHPINASLQWQAHDQTNTKNVLPEQSANSVKQIWQDTGQYDTVEIDSEALNIALEQINKNLSVGAYGEALLTSNIRPVVSDVPMTLSLASSDEYNTASETPPVLEHTSIFSNPIRQAAALLDYDVSKYALLDEGQKLEYEPALERAVEDIRVSSVNPSLLLVLSGMGGPALIRTMLEQIKTDYLGVVVVAHDVDVTQLCKLRDQLQKIARIPIVVPKHNEVLKSGHIYLFATHQTIQTTSLGYQCIQGVSLIDYLNQMNQQLEIVILSGANALLAQTLIQSHSRLSNVHVQAPADCFEPALVQLLNNVGAPVLDQNVFAQWFN